LQLHLQTVSSAMCFLLHRFHIIDYRHYRGPCKRKEVNMICFVLTN
jgi:hypothetical protein